MEKWQAEIVRLNSIREELGLNLNQLEKLSGINRTQLRRFFEMENIPSLRLFIQVKDCLESDVKSEKKEPVVSEPVKFIKNDCECYLDSEGLLRRGKTKCSKSKSEHKFQ